MCQFALYRVWLLQKFPSVHKITQRVVRDVTCAALCFSWRVDDIDKRVTMLKILPALQQQSANFIARLQRYVWPSLEGADHAMLIYYYTLLGGCPERC